MYLHFTKIENADQVYEKHLGGLLSPPVFEHKQRQQNESSTKQESEKEFNVEQEFGTTTETVSTMETATTSSPVTTPTPTKSIDTTETTEKSSQRIFPELVGNEYFLNGYAEDQAFVDIVFSG